MKKVSLVELPPTSSTINGHLERSYYVVNMCINLLNGKELLNPLDYSWRETPGGLLPNKRELTLPLEYTITCSCKSACSGRCKCVKNEVMCTIFCKCDESCKND